MSWRLTRTRVVALVTAVVLVVLAGGAVGMVERQRNDLPSGAVFRYGDRVVRAAELDRRVDVLSALYGVRKPSGKTAQGSFERDAAASMAMSLVLERAEARRGIVISGKEARDELDKLIAQQLTGGQAAFTEFLATHRLSEDDVLDEIKQQLATSQLALQVTAKVAPATESAVRAAYVRNQNDMTSAEMRSLLNIVTSTRADAERVFRLARRGARFAELARTWSRDASTRDKGGALGTVSADQLEPGYAKAAFAAPVHGVFGPVQTQFGWNVGKVVSVVPPVPVSFAQIKADLTKALDDKAKLEAWNRYLKSLLEAAHVEYADRYRPMHPTSLPSGLAPSASAGPQSGER